MIYDSEGSYSHHDRAPDRTHPALAPPADDVHPMWCTHLHYPERGQAGEDGSHTIPHSTLEWMAAFNGFDVDELDTILDVTLHCAHVPDTDDVLSWMNPSAVRLMQVVHDDLPDPMTPRMPYAERREVLLARSSAVKDHLMDIGPAALEDRCGALYARASTVLDVEAQLAEHGLLLPPQFKLGLDDQPPEHPLDPILKVARLDPARVGARRARDEWLQARQDAAISRALTAARSPMTFGIVRQPAPKVTDLLAALQPARRGERPARTQPGTVEVRRSRSS